MRYGIMLGLVLGFPLVALAEGSFVDVTSESGVKAAVEANYEKYPKWWMSGVNLVDLDGDGNLDLFLAAHGAGKAIALLGDGKGHFSVARGEWPTTEIHLACDINEDGKLDLQMTYQDGGAKWWTNQSTPGVLKFKDSGVTAQQGRANAMIDINVDGKVDWLHERPGVVFELGDGHGHFKPGGGLPIPQTRNEVNVHPVDLNGDGLIDLVVHWGRYDYEKGRSRIYLNRGQMRFEDATAQVGLHEDGLAIKGIGDVNQDGSMDLLVLENKRPEVYLNDGHGRFTRKAGAIKGIEQASHPNYVSWGLAAVVDIDNDGRPDVIWNGRNFLWLLKGAGDGTFQYMNKNWKIDDRSAATVDDGLCFGDIDGDGAIDVIGYSKIEDHRQIKVYRNALAQGNWLNVDLIGAAANACAAGAKIWVRDGQKLIAFEQVMILDSQSAHSYYALAPTQRHFGAGAAKTLDVTVEFYPSRKVIQRKGASVNTTLQVRED